MAAPAPIPSAATPSEPPRLQVAPAAPGLEEPYFRRRLRLKSFLFTSALAVGSSVTLFLLMVRIDVLDTFFKHVLLAAAYFKPVLALIAASPLFFSLLIGYGYMQRGIARRKREAAEAAARANS